jgi:transcription initiation factor TFIID subunit 5
MTTDFFRSRGYDPNTPIEGRSVDLSTFQVCLNFCTFNRISLISLLHHQDMATSTLISAPSLQSISDRSPSTYLQNYSQISEWVDHSLDLYHPELYMLLWPLFVHCFIGIVSGTPQPSTMGRNFLEKYSPAFCDRPSSSKEDNENVGGGGGALFGDFSHEIRHLMSISAREHLEFSPLVKSYRTHRYTISLSRQTFELFQIFLQEHNLFLLASIFNSHIHTRIVAKYPQEVDPEYFIGGGDFGGLTGVLPGKQDEMTKRVVLWGMIEGSVETKFLKDELAREGQSSYIVKPNFHLPKVFLIRFDSLLIHY